MNKKRILYFHIGFPKTASSLLQRYLFCNNENINYLGIPLKKNWGSSEWLLHNFLNQLFTSEKQNFYSNLDYYKKKFININFKIEQINLISHDILTNSTYLNNYDIYECIERIHFFFKIKLKYEVKIFFSIRNQEKMIKSFYAQFYRKLIKINKKWRSFKEFINSLNILTSNNSLENTFSSKIYNNFSYFSYYNSLKKKFGESNVKILIYEDLIYEPKKYFKDLSEFLNISIDSYELITKENINVTNIIDGDEYERKYVLVYKNLSKFIKYNSIKKILYRALTSDKVILSNQEKKMINKFYLKENTYLNKILENRLNKYNYL